MEIIRLEYSDSFYPKCLKEIYNPPKEIYLLGNVNLLKEKCIASVGSRNCSDYGRNIAFKIGRSSAINNVTLVSGMAKGIDYYSHKGALSCNGNTIAVLGSGVNYCYPKESEDIYRIIKEKGLIISEQKPNSKPTKIAFPLRNRIISALSTVVVIVEAEIKSGSMITAEIANEQGKSVMVVPGNIDSRNSLGTNKLIADGAKIITTIDEIFYEIGILPKNNADLSFAEKEIINLIKECGEISIEKLNSIYHTDNETMKEIISNLVMKGCVFYELGKVFIAK